MEGLLMMFGKFMNGMSGSMVGACAFHGRGSVHSCLLFRFCLVCSYFGMREEFCIQAAGAAITTTIKESTKIDCDLH